MQERKPPSYRLAAFTHWSNLAALATLGVGGMLVDPSLWYALVPLQALVLWLGPDLPPLRRALDARVAQEQLDAERAYYLEQLWGLAPLAPKSAGARLQALFVGEPKVDPDARLLGGRGSEKYREMRDILAKLRDMVPIAAGRVTEPDIERIDHVIVSYLRLLVACQPLGRALNATDEAGLHAQLQYVDARLGGADAALRAVLLEQKRLVESQLARLPRLRATLELLHVRAEAIPQQLRNLQSQVLTDPGSEVHSMLDDLIERNDVLADPLADLQADEAVRELLSDAHARAPAPARARRVEVSR
jgi:hypothetical protein